jgi:hypothetical protein
VVVVVAMALAPVHLVDLAVVVNLMGLLVVQDLNLRKIQEYLEYNNLDTLVLEEIQAQI